MGQIIKLRAYPNASFRDVTAPNADTLYTTGFFDVGKEPWVLSIPDMKGRYALLPMLDGWTTVFQVPGKRTTGTGAQTYAITGPGWKGTLARRCEGVQVADQHRLAARPHLLHRHAGRLRRRPQAAGRIQARPAELLRQAVYAARTTRSIRSIDMKTAVREQVNRMDAAAYFTLLCKLMKDNPPAAADAPQLAKFARIGIVPGQDFDASKLKADFVKRVPEIGFDRIMLQFKVNKDMKDENGWAFTTKTGIYGTDYLMRALVTAIGLGANRPQDAVYPTSMKDAEGRKYSGANKYVMHFPKGQLPPVTRLLVADDVQQPIISSWTIRSTATRSAHGRI